MKWKRPSEWFNRRRADYRIVFESAAGQRVLRRIFKENYIGADPFVPGDEFATMVNLGRQRAATGIAGILNMDDRTMLQIAQERSEEDED